MRAFKGLGGRNFRIFLHVIPKFSILEGKILRVKFYIDG
jgi:hypothetical protein